MRAVAAYLIEKDLHRRGVIIGYDTRFFAEGFAAAVVEEMRARGAKVYLC